MDEEKTPRRFRIDPNVRLGDLLLLGTIVLTGTAAFFNLKSAQEQNARDLAVMQVVQRDRDSQQDQLVVRIEGTLKEGVTQIRSEQLDLRREVSEIGRYVRNRGG